MTAFGHPALFYGSDEDYLAGLVPFVTDGLEQAQPVAVAVPSHRLELLRAAVPGADKATWIDMLEAGRNPGRIIPAVLRGFADRHPGKPVRIIGEPIWPGRSATEYPACAQHEALINHAFAGRDVTIVCPYDTVRLDPSAIADARATHPVVWERERRDASDGYAPDDVLARCNQPLPEPDEAVDLVVGTAAELGGLRRWVAEHAGQLLSQYRLADLELLVTELVTNGIEHAGSATRVRLWRVDDHVVCEVRSSGRITDPLAGRHPYRSDAIRGRGLLLVHDLADLVRTHETAEGTTHYALLRIGF